MSGVNVCSHFSPATLLLRAGPVSQGSARAGQEEGWGEALFQTGPWAPSQLDQRAPGAGQVQYNKAQPAPPAIALGACFPWESLGQSGEWQGRSAVAAILICSKPCLYSNSLVQREGQAREEGGKGKREGVVLKVRNWL